MSTDRPAGPPRVRPRAHLVRGEAWSTGSVADRAPPRAPPAPAPRSRSTRRARSSSRCATLAVEARDHVADADRPARARRRRPGRRRRPRGLGRGERRRLPHGRRPARRRGSARRARGAGDRRAGRGSSTRSARASPARRSARCSAILSSRVLGQYELFTAPGATPRLLLVAPNLLAAERAMGVDPHDFRLWVCLHEETHRVQFTAVPWLGDHLRGEVAALRRGHRPRPRLGRPSGSARSPTRCAPRSRGTRRPGGRRGRDDAGAARRPRPRHRRHDAARGPRRLRDGRGRPDGRADRRRRSAASSSSAAARGGATEQVLRRLLGVDAKLAQYRDGAAFVRAVVGRGRHGRLQRDLDLARDAAAARTRSPIRAPGCARVHG